MAPLAQLNDVDTVANKTPINDEPHDRAFERMLQEDPEFRAAYDGQEEGYAFLRECLRARKRSKLSQKEVASRMGTTDSAVSRLEQSLIKGKAVPSMATLQRYANALGHRLVIKFEPLDKKPKKK